MVFLTDSVRIVFILLQTFVIKKNIQCFDQRQALNYFVDGENCENKVLTLQGHCYEKEFMICFGKKENCHNDQIIMVTRRIMKTKSDTSRLSIMI